MRLQRGDVVVCQLFAYGYKETFDTAEDPIRIDGEREEHRIVTVELSKEIRQMTAAMTGHPAEAYQDVDQAVYDESRGVAEFVIEDVTSEEAASMGNNYSASPASYRARRLSGSGEYNPNGEAVEFSDDSDLMSHIKIVRKMKPAFT